VKEANQHLSETLEETLRAENLVYLEKN